MTLNDSADLDTLLTCAILDSEDKMPMFARVRCPANHVKKRLEELLHAPCEGCTLPSPGALKIYRLDGEICGLLCPKCLKVVDKANRDPALLSSLSRFLRSAKNRTTKVYKEVQEVMYAQECKEQLTFMREERKDLRRIEREHKKAHKVLLPYESSKPNPNTK